VITVSLKPEQVAQIEASLKSVNQSRAAHAAAVVAQEMATQRIESLHQSRTAQSAKAAGGDEKQVMSLMIVERQIQFAEQAKIRSEKELETALSTVGAKLNEAAQLADSILATVQKAVAERVAHQLAQFISNPVEVDDLVERSSPMTAFREFSHRATYFTSYSARDTNPLVAAKDFEEAVKRILAGPLEFGTATAN
jgi:hypothetical protein